MLSDMKTHSSLTGEEMKAAREAIGLTTTQVAASLGVSERTVTRWEAGGNIPEPCVRLFRILHNIESDREHVSDRL